MTGNCMIRVDQVSKKYILGQIGGTTLRNELQRLRAKIRGQEDPTRRIGAKVYPKGETFMALEGVSFSVNSGERVGIIGHNGAGKSTLLKLISRVTAPSEGFIGLNGRVASMLEVGTGFHPELTGRENIYMNGAILGMTKAEIDSKIEDIIEFSECRRFIDTPVKRYSSGMYVKLAFSVAAHLDSEIMIMDEVLAVGDMAFQKKCLGKMSEVSEEKERTILYVSHNMATIKALCTRCIVMDHGHILFDGGVDEAIGIYSGLKKMQASAQFDLTTEERRGFAEVFSKVRMQELVYRDKMGNSFRRGEMLRLTLTVEAADTVDCLELKMSIVSENGDMIGTAFSDRFSVPQGVRRINTAFDTSVIPDGLYRVQLSLWERKENGTTIVHDRVQERISFLITDGDEKPWKAQWGNTRYPEMEISVE